MFITNNYKDVRKGNYKYVFYLNNRDVFECKRDFVIQLNILIERFSRDLENSGLIVKTYESDIEKTRGDILDKPWTKWQLETIRKTPGMLMIDVDFNIFNPNKHNWIYFYFVKDQRFKKNKNISYTIDEAEELFNKLTELITQTDCNIYQEVKEARLKTRRKSVMQKVGEKCLSYGSAMGAEQLFKILNKILQDIIS